MKKFIGLLATAGLLIPSAAMAGSINNESGASAKRVSAAGWSVTDVKVNSEIHKNNTMYVIGANWGGSISADAENLSWGSREMDYSYNRGTVGAAGENEFDNDYKVKSEFASAGDFAVREVSDGGYYDEGHSYESGEYHDNYRDVSRTHYDENTEGEDSSTTIGGSIGGGGGSTHETTETVTEPGTTCGKKSKKCEPSPEVVTTTTTTSGGGGGGELYGEHTSGHSSETTDGSSRTVDRGVANGTNSSEGSYYDEGGYDDFSRTSGGYEVEGEGKLEGQGNAAAAATADGATASSHGHGWEHFVDGAGTINRDGYANGYAGRLHENGTTKTTVAMDQKDVFTSRGFETSSFSSTSWD